VKNKISIQWCKKTVFFLLCLCLLGTLTACAAPGQEAEADDADDGKIQIGICFDSYLIERWERDRDVFVSAAKELGAEVNVQNANGDSKEQIARIEYLIEKKMDVIVIVCIDSDGLSEVVQKARDAGIAVIAYDRMIHDADVDLYISFDNEKVGTLMGEAMVKAGLRGEKVLMLSGPTSDHNVLMVNEGFTQVMKQNHIEIMDIMYADNWKPEYASDYIYEHPEVLDEVSGIMCGNDSLATQAIRVLAEKRKAGQIIVTGQDAELEACQRIVEGTQLMTVYKPVEKQAKVAAECAIALAKGEPVEGINTSTSDGTYSIPSIILDPVAVDADNIDEIIIDSGFHLRDEVYLNVVER
jgi:D-xylose transport system substrate-binding protein